MLSEIIFNFKDPNWYYIMAVSLQVAGALLLTLKFWGNTEKKVFSMYYQNTNNDPVIESKITLKKDELQKCAVKIYMNRVTFIYIVLGYIVGVFGEITLNCRGCIAFSIIATTAVLLLLGYLLVHIIAKLVYRQDIDVDYKEFSSKYNVNTNIVIF